MFLIKWIVFYFKFFLQGTNEILKPLKSTEEHLWEASCAESAGS